MRSKPHLVTIYGYFPIEEKLSRVNVPGRFAKASSLL
jgi:hypothetical protein